MSDAPPPLSPEDLVRSHDRQRVVAARRGGRGVALVWLLAGPGVLAMLGENDGPSMLSYAASGAQYGIGFFLPFIAVTFLAAYVVQEMAMRLGAVTHRGYGELVFQRFGPFWGWLTAGDLVVTNLITLITEVIAIRAGMAFFGLPAWVAALAAVLLVTVSSSGGRYWRWERAVMALALFNLLFVAAAWLTHPSGGSIAHAMASWTPLPAGKPADILLLLASNIGATVTPWMLFFQQSASADKGMTPRDIRQGRIDTGIGTVLAALAGCATVVAAAPLFTAGIDTGALQAGTGFAEAMLPVVGRPAATLFALGLIEAGAVAMLTISASTAYAVGEVIGGEGHSFNRSLRDAPAFHAANIGLAAVAAAIVLIPGIPLLSIALNANLLATVLMPPALLFLLIMANDRELMGARVNRRSTNVVAITIAVLVTLAGSAAAIVAFVGTFR